MSKYIYRSYVPKRNAALCFSLHFLLQIPKVDIEDLLLTDYIMMLLSRGFVDSEQFIKFSSAKYRLATQAIANMVETIISRAKTISLQTTFIDTAGDTTRKSVIGKPVVLVADIYGPPECFDYTFEEGEEGQDKPFEPFLPQWTIGTVVSVDNEGNCLAEFNGIKDGIKTVRVVIPDGGCLIKTDSISHLFQ